MNKILELICNVKGHSYCNGFLSEGECILDPGCYKAAESYIGHCHLCGK